MKYLDTDIIVFDDFEQIISLAEDLAKSDALTFEAVEALSAFLSDPVQLWDEIDERGLAVAGTLLERWIDSQ